MLHYKPTVQGFITITFVSEYLNLTGNARKCNLLFSQKSNLILRRIRFNLHHNVRHCERFG